MLTTKLKFNHSSMNMTKLYIKYLSLFFLLIGVSRIFKWISSFELYISMYFN